MAASNNLIYTYNVSYRFSNMKKKPIAIFLGGGLVDFLTENNITFVISSTQKCFLLSPAIGAVLRSTSTETVGISASLLNVK